MKPKTRILIVDDHEVVREGIKALLTSKKPEWVICGEATDSSGAIERTRILKPDLVLLDISLSLPGMGGLEASSQIRKMGLTMPILMSTTHDFERLDAYVRKAGAQGFVQKSQAFGTLSEPSSACSRAALSLA